VTTQTAPDEVKAIKTFIEDHGHHAFLHKNDDIYVINTYKRSSFQIVIHHDGLAITSRDTPYNAITPDVLLPTTFISLSDPACLDKLLKILEGS
jgi:hypothetical protein